MYSKMFVCFLLLQLQGAGVSPAVRVLLFVMGWCLHLSLTCPNPRVSPLASILFLPPSARHPLAGVSLNWLRRTGHRAALRLHKWFLVLALCDDKMTGSYFQKPLQFKRLNITLSSRYLKLFEFTFSCDRSTCRRFWLRKWGFLDSSNLLNMYSFDPFYLVKCFLYTSSKVM